MFDIDTLPDIYETMIDRPAILYDTLANFSSILRKNSSVYCSFFIHQLNYTEEECAEIFNHTEIQFSQVRFFTDCSTKKMIKEKIFSATSETRSNRRWTVLCRDNTLIQRNFAHHCFVELINMFCFLSIRFLISFARWNLVKNAIWSMMIRWIPLSSIVIFSSNRVFLRLKWFKWPY